MFALFCFALFFQFLHFDQYIWLDYQYKKECEQRKRKLNEVLDRDDVDDDSDDEIPIDCDDGSEDEQEVRNQSTGRRYVH